MDLPTCEVSSKHFPNGIVLVGIRRQWLEEALQEAKRVYESEIHPAPVEALHERDISLPVFRYESDSTIEVGGKFLDEQIALVVASVVEDYRDGPRVLVVQIACLMRWTLVSSPQVEWSLAFFSPSLNALLHMWQLVLLRSQRCHKLWMFVRPIQLIR